MSTYALAKVSGEALVRRYRELYSMDAVSVRFSDVYGRMDRDTGARNRHNAPYWLCRKVLAIHTAANRSDAPNVVVAGTSLQDVGWDIVDAPSVARGLCAILRADERPRRSLYHLALGYTPTHGETLEAVAAAVHAAPHVANIYGVDSIVTMAKAAADGATGVNAAVQGLVDLQTLPADHWLHANPMEIGPMADEFGWAPSTVKVAMLEYVRHLKAVLP